MFDTSEYWWKRGRNDGFFANGFDRDRGLLKTKWKFNADDTTWVVKLGGGARDLSLKVGSLLRMYRTHQTQAKHSKLH